MTQRRERPGEASTRLAFPTRNDLPADVREPMVETLNRCLADTTDLFTQAKFAHWNVKGGNFYQLHLLFDELAETLAEHQDLLAERATALGGQALGTVRMATVNSSVPEIPADAVTGDEYVRAVADNLAVHAANLRQHVDAADGYGDEDTMDLFVEISRDVDKYLWFLDAHLQTRPVGDGLRTEGGVGSAAGRDRQPVRSGGYRRYGRPSGESGSRGRQSRVR